MARKNPVSKEKSTKKKPTNWLRIVKAARRINQPKHNGKTW